MKKYKIIQQKIEQKKEDILEFICDPQYFNWTIGIPFLIAVLGIMFLQNNYNRFIPEKQLSPVASTTKKPVIAEICIKPEQFQIDKDTVIERCSVYQFNKLNENQEWEVLKPIKK